MGIRRVILPLVFLVLAAACGRQPGATERAEEGAAVTPSAAASQATRPARTGTTVLADGRLVTVRPALTLGFSSSGRVEVIHVEAGQTVAEGALLATLDDAALAEAVSNAELQLAQAENTLAQVRLSLEKLEGWTPDELAVALAQANLAAAEAAYEQAQARDAAASSSLTSARVSVDQARRALADAQETYQRAWEPARDWELEVPWRKIQLEAEREATARAVQNAEEGLTVAQANYNLALAGLDVDSALSAQASLASARQAMSQAQSGPEQADIAAARLQVEQAQLSVDQASFNLDRARTALRDAELLAPWPGTLLSVEAVPGALVAGGTPIVTLVDIQGLQFHTSNLSERDLADLEAGQPAQVTLKSHPGQALDGAVVRIAPQASGSVGDAATFVVVIELAPTELLLLPGMTGRVEISR